MWYIYSSPKKSQTRKNPLFYNTFTTTQSKTQSHFHNNFISIFNITHHRLVLLNITNTTKNLLLKTTQQLIFFIKIY